MTDFLIQHPIEFSWLGLACLVVALGALGLNEAMTDATFLAASGVNGPRKIIADANIRQEGKRVALGFLNGAGAVSAMFLQDQRVGIAAGIASMFVLIGAGVLDRAARKRLGEYAARTVMDPATGQIIDKPIGIAGTLTPPATRDESGPRP